MRRMEKCHTDGFEMRERGQLIFQTGYHGDRFSFRKYLAAHHVHKIYTMQMMKDVRSWTLAYIICSVPNQ